MENNKHFFEIETSHRAQRLLEKAYEDELRLENAVVFVCDLLADKNGRVHIDKSDLMGLIANLVRNFK